MGSEKSSLIIIHTEKNSFYVRKTRKLSIIVVWYGRQFWKYRINWVEIFWELQLFEMMEGFIFTEIEEIMIKKKKKKKIWNICWMLSFFDFQKLGKTIQADTEKRNN